MRDMADQGANVPERKNQGVNAPESGNQHQGANVPESGNRQLFDDESALDYAVRTVRDSGYRTVAACVGLACLWLCLQASGFYPLSVLGNLAECSAETIAHCHVVYSAALVVFAALTIVANDAVRSLLFRRSFGLAAGVAGIVGHLLLAFSRIDGSPNAAVIVGVVLVAFFIAAATLFWMERISGNDSAGTMLLIAVSYLVSQLVSVAYFAVVPTQTPLLIGCCVLCTVCSAIVGEGNPLEDEQRPTRSIRKLPWSLVVPALFLVYFCEIFIRLRIGDFGGDASVARKLLTSLVAGGAFTVVAGALLLSRKQDAQRSLIVTFAVLVVAYLVALLAMLLFDASAQSVTNRVLIASSHCVEVFLWMVVLSAVNEHRMSPTACYGFMLIVAVAVPWALSFDAYYLLGLDQSIGTLDILVPGVAIALVVAAVGTIVVLLRYAFAIGSATNGGAKGPNADAATPETAATKRPTVREALEPYGLTNREHEVAEYLYRGYSAKRIAEILFLSEASIRAYTMHIYRKMDVHSKQELIDRIDDDQR